MSRRPHARKTQADRELTENIGLPLALLDTHAPWPAYVTHTSPAVRRLLEKSRARDLERLQPPPGGGGALRPNAPPGVTLLRRKKPSKTSSHLVTKDTKPEAAAAGWGALSVLTPGGAVTPESTHIPPGARGSPMATCNKIIFSRRPGTRMLPYGPLLASHPL